MSIESLIVERLMGTRIKDRNIQFNLVDGVVYPFAKQGGTTYLEIGFIGTEEELKRLIDGDKLIDSITKQRLTGNEKVGIGPAVDIFSSAEVGSIVFFKPRKISCWMGEEDWRKINDE